MYHLKLNAMVMRSIGAEVPSKYPTTIVMVEDIVWQIVKAI